MNWVALAQDNDVVASTSDELMCTMKGMKFFYHLIACLLQYLVSWR
jgi:uncharacterized Zn-finger protein